MSPFFAFAHHVAAFTLAATLAVQWVLLRDTPAPASIRQLARADALYGLSAVTLVVVGGLRVFQFEKGAAFYLHNGAFLAKIGVFVAIGLLSILPTMRFNGWARAVKAGGEPTIDPSMLRTVRRLVTIELFAVVPILLFAALMARGIGQFR